MASKYILFLSTNLIWGGSEVLWTASAKRLAAKGFRVNAGLFYGYESVEQFIGKREYYIDLGHVEMPLPLFFRLIRKLRLAKFPSKNILHENLKTMRPDLVIISQGNNIDGRNFMADCIRFNIPFITLTQLVTLDFWPALNDEIINELRSLYLQANCNYFVSANTQLLHERLLGEKCNNGVVVYNPFTKDMKPGFSFPPVVDGIYKVALVGRVETFHKGYDLLIDVLKQQKWKNRPVHFSIFGKGPHVELLQRLIKTNGIENIFFNNYIEDVAEIWKEHHILLMPSRMEGQSLSLIEAMRFGRAAIVTDVGGTNELIEDGINGFIATHPIAEYIDAALERAWGKRNEWSQLGIAAAEAIVKKHPADAVGFLNDQIEKMIETN